MEGGREGGREGEEKTWLSARAKYYKDKRPPPLILLF